MVIKVLFQRRSTARVQLPLNQAVALTSIYFHYIMNDVSLSPEDAY